MKLSALNALVATQFFLFFFAGCPRTESGPDERPEERPLAGVKLTIAVADDAVLAATIARVEGEWNAQTGADFELIETTEAALEKADALPADAVVCPSHFLGVLAEGDRLAPVPKKYLQSRHWADIFPLLRLREAAWGDQILAVPFGSPVFCCYYRADLLEKLGRRPPRTWAEYQELAKLLETNAPRPLGEEQGVRAWSPAIEPLAPGWAGLVLLARAASYAKHRDHFSTLFNLETMEPKVADPPMVLALEELVAASKVGPADPFQYDPAAARAAFWRGECGIALTWPSAAETHSTASNLRVGFCELPGSSRVFNGSRRVWDRRAENEENSVPLLSVAGRLGVVNAKSSQTDAAFQLLLWLSGREMSEQVCPASPSTTLFRQSHLQSPGQWMEKQTPASAARQYAEVSEATFRRQQWLSALPIPGRGEYLAALDEAVRVAVRGEKTPLDALLDADAKWRKITDRLGVERQRATYRHCLGL